MSPQNQVWSVQAKSYRSVWCQCQWITWRDIRAIPPVSFHRRSLRAISLWYQMTDHKHRTATIIWRSFLNPICATRNKTTWDCLGSHLPKSPICSDLKLSSHLQVVNIRIAGNNLKTQNKTCLLEAQPNRKCTSFLLTRDVFMKPSIVRWRWGLFPFV